MASYPLPVATSAFKVTYKFNEGVFGWSFEIFLSSTTPTWAIAEAGAKKLAGAITPWLNTNAALVGYRVEQAQNPGFGSELITDPGAGCGPGMGAASPVGAPAEPIWDGVVCNLWDATRIYQRSIELRGLPAGAINFSPLGEPALVEKNAAVMKLETFLRYLAGASSGTGNTSVVRGRYRDPTATLPLTIQSAAPDNTGCNTVLTVSTPTQPNPPYSPSTSPYLPFPATVTYNGVVLPAYQIGQKVHLHNVQGCGSIGLNGDARIVAITPPATSTYGTITVSRTPCCCGTYTIKPGTGTLSLVNYAFWALAVVSTGRAVKRDTGGNFFKPRGRRRTCKR